MYITSDKRYFNTVVLFPNDPFSYKLLELNKINETAYWANAVYKIINYKTEFRIDIKKLSYIGIHKKTIFYKIEEFFKELEKINKFHANMNNSSVYDIDIVNIYDLYLYLYNEIKNRTNIQHTINIFKNVDVDYYKMLSNKMSQFNYYFK